MIDTIRTEMDAETFVEAFQRNAIESATKHLVESSIMLIASIETIIGLTRHMPEWNRATALDGIADITEPLYDLLNNIRTGRKETSHES